jgi:hypothetical protein
MNNYERFGRQVWDWLIGDNWQSEDGEELMSMAVDLGLAHMAPYDPVKHGEDIDAEPGDEIYVFSPPDKSAVIV